ncbi:hypothetical protein [Terrimicrobium sacchariphilum]|uniref:hypothetical protein n=1 Tax=Terrimicrobium sacchariphilum TaxID=690879 RepID=UPI001EDC564B|nr:hypothetical protein [Terrimicrobium sacchariphilum]
MASTINLIPVADNDELSLPKSRGIAWNLKSGAKIPFSSRQIAAFMSLYDESGFGLGRRDDFSGRIIWREG